MELFHGKAKKMNHVRKASHYMAEKQTTEVFGVVGSSHGVGVTYVSILLANYMTGIKNRKTAILEWNSNGDFDRTYCDPPFVRASAGNLAGNVWD